MIGLQFDVLGLLYDQHRQYMAELGRAHQSLSRLYAELSSIEHQLSRRQELGLTRKAKKRLQWSRSETKHAVRMAELLGASLHESLRQCNNLIASYSVCSETPWAMPSAPYSAMSIPFTPAHHAIDCSLQTHFVEPQIWDLSMLPDAISPQERQSFARAESSASPLSPVGGTRSGSEHIFAHETLQQQESSVAALGQMDPTVSRTISAADDVPQSQEAQDHVCDLPVNWNPAYRDAAATTGASDGNEDDLKGHPLPHDSTSTTSHKRRFSENAIQIIEARLAAPSVPTGSTAQVVASRSAKYGHRRGISLGSNWHPF